MTARFAKITVTPLDTPGLIGFETEIFDSVIRKVASLQDQIVREQLIAAGWMPPPATPRDDSSSSMTKSDAERKLDEIRSAIRDYHFALDTRQHGGGAQSHAIERISELLGMPWETGREKAARDAAAAVSPSPGRTPSASAE